MNGRAMVLLAVVLALTAYYFAEAAPNDPGQGRSSDQELLKELNSRSTNDVDRELFGPEEQKPPAVKPGPEAAKPSAGKPEPGAKQPPKPAGDADRDLSRQLKGELGRAGTSEPDSPLVDIARQMKNVEGRINQADCGSQTQQLQGRIVSDLDQLLKEAKKKMSAQQKKKKPSGYGGSSSPGGRPARQPKPVPITKSPPPPPPPNKNTPSPGVPTPDRDQRLAIQKQVWGDLPEHERLQMQQYQPAEVFLPKYELLIEEYYKRLAEEKKDKDE